MTDSEMLTKVETSISRILDGAQDITLADKRIINARLDILFRQRDFLIRKIAKASATGPPRNTGLLKR